MFMRVPIRAFGKRSCMRGGSLHQRRAGALAIESGGSGPRSGGSRPRSARERAEQLIEVLAGVQLGDRDQQILAPIDSEAAEVDAADDVSLGQTG